jgi:hypothetical protein
MPLKKILLLLLIGSSFTACKQSTLTYDKPYFDFDSLMTKQVTLLSKSNDSIKKVANMDGKEDTASFVADSTALAHELDVFLQLDIINKPLFKSAYSYLANEKDLKSNLSVRTYRLNEKVKSPVSFVRFYYLDDFKNIKKIESSFQEQNTLYFSKRNLRLEFNDEMLLKAYSISGVQKMILNDSVKFTVSGSIF